MNHTSQKLRMARKIIISLMFLLNIFIDPCFAEKLAVTLGNSWLGIKYNILNKINSELRYVIDPDMSIISLRGAYSFRRKDKMSAFAGLEYGIINFKYDGISGSGTQITPFIGSEYNLTSKLGLGIDFGYSTINLKSEDVSVSGTEYVFNVYLSYFIF